MTIKVKHLISKPIAQNLSEEQIKILRIISGNNDYQYNLLLRHTSEQIDKLIIGYHQRKPVINDLNKHGINVHDLDQYRFSKLDENIYLRAIPVLVTWLKKNELESDVKSEIIGLLIERPISKKYAFDTIIEQYKITDCNYHNGFCQLMENAFIRWLDDSFANTLLELLNKDKYKLRMLLYLSLPKLKNPRNRKKAIEFLIGRLEEYNSKNIGYPAIPIEALRKLDATHTKGLVKKFLTHSNSEVRREARKTIAKFEKTYKSNN